MTVSGWSLSSSTARCSARCPGGELVARRVGDHAGVGLVADPQAVLGEQARRRRRCTSRPSARSGSSSSLGDRAPVASSGRPQERARGSWRQLVGRLGGEGEARAPDRGATGPVATSQTTRAAITVVLPDPAPAITTAGASGALIAANCCVAERERRAHQPLQALGGVGASRQRRRHESTVPAPLVGQIAWNVAVLAVLAGSRRELLARGPAARPRISCSSTGGGPSASGSCGCLLLDLRAA